MTTKILQTLEAWRVWLGQPDTEREQTFDGTAHDGYATVRIWVWLARDADGCVKATNDEVLAGIAATYDRLTILADLGLVTMIENGPPPTPPMCSACGLPHEAPMHPGRLCSWSITEAGRTHLAGLAVAA